ncbi:MAG: response regulator [Myxococcota bacterium]
MGGLILYIDDEPQLPAGFEDDLKEEGFELVFADDPELASRLVRVDDPDLVLMEVVLSSCDGIDLLEAIRSFGGWPAQVPIIVVTNGQRTPELYGRALEADVKEFFTKPVLKSQLLDSVRKFAGAVPEPEPTLSGDLADLPIPEILHCLRQDAATGVLIATHGRTQRSIQFRNGSPVAVSTMGGVEAPEDFLARRNLITEKQRMAVREQVDAGTRGSGEALIAIGAASEDQLNAALRCQAEEQLLQTFRWDSGPIDFFPGESIEAKSKQPIDGNPAELIVLGVQNGSLAGAVSEALHDRADLYVSREPKPPYELGSIPLSSSERVFLENMNGDRSVREVLESGELSERLLYALFVAGFVFLHPEPVMMLLEEVGEVPQASPPRAAPTPPAPISPPTPPTGSKPSRPVRVPSPGAAHVARGEGSIDVADVLHAAVAQRAQVTFSGLCQRISSLDDFGVLGVSEEASDPEVRTAYEKLVSGIPFDDVPADATKLREVAERVRKRIDLAFEHLESVESRRAYAATCREENTALEKKEAATRAFEAESSFRKGEQLLKAKKYGAAVEAFGISAHLDPGEGEYVAHLGYALFLSNPKEPIVLREALEHLAKGIKLSPRREKPYLYLGRIFRRNDAPDRARKMFERAVRIKPDCHAAVQELRLLESREKKRGGLLKRLMRKT